MHVEAISWAVRQVTESIVSGSPVNKQKLANQMLRGKDMAVAETSLTRVRAANGKTYTQYNFNTLPAWTCP